MQHARGLVCVLSSRPSHCCGRLCFRAFSATCCHAVPCGRLSRLCDKLEAPSVINCLQVHGLGGAHRAGEGAQDGPQPHPRGCRQSHHSHPCREQPAASAKQVFRREGAGKRSCARPRSVPAEPADAGANAAGCGRCKHEPALTLSRQHRIGRCAEIPGASRAINTFYGRDWTIANDSQLRALQYCNDCLDASHLLGAV